MPYLIKKSNKYKILKYIIVNILVPPYNVVYSLFLVQGVKSCQTLKNVKSRLLISSEILEKNLLIRISIIAD